MPNVDAQFQGQTIVVPGSYYADNVQATLPANAALIPPLIFIGFGYGQKPLTPITYNSAQELYSAIRGGPCAPFVQFLTNPSNALNGASQITYINPGENTQSTLTLDDSAGAAAVVLTSTNYGLPSNLLQAEVGAGSAGGTTISLTIFDGYSNTSAFGDNLGTPFQIAYTGSGTGVTYAFTSSGDLTTSMVLTSPDPGESFTIPFGAGMYTTVSQVVEYINGTGAYAAQVISATSGQLPSENIYSGQSGTLPAPSDSVLSYVGITSAVEDVVFWVNQFASTFCTAVSGTVNNSPSSIPAGIPLTFFSGAQSVPPTQGDYADAFNAALNIPGWVICTDSNSAGVIALGTAHAVQASTPLGAAWRRFISGSNIGDTVTATATMARSMDAYEATYCYPGIYRTDTNTGVNTLFGGVYVAAAVAGMMAGNIVAQPLTNQPLVGNGVETQLTVSNIDLLQKAGVMPIWVSPQTQVPTIISDLTTWQIDSSPENLFNQQVACRFSLAYSLSQGLQPYVGTIASQYGLSRIKNAAISILNQLVYSPGNNGILVSWDASSLVITYTGSTQTVNLSVNVVFVGQVRFIFELTFVQPLSLAA